MDGEEDSRRIIEQSGFSTDILVVQHQLVDLEDELNQARENGQFVSVLLVRRLNLNEHLVRLQERHSREEEPAHLPPTLPTQPQSAINGRPLRRSLRRRISEGPTNLRPTLPLPSQPQPAINGRQIRALRQRISEGATNLRPTLPLLPQSLLARNEALLGRSLRGRTEIASNMNNDQGSTARTQDPQASRRLPDGRPEETALHEWSSLESQSMRAERNANRFGNPTIYAGADDRPAILSKCISCADQSAGEPFAHLECGHCYCPDCLQRLFAIACNNEQSFPPRCCTVRILVEHVAAFLSLEAKSNYVQKEIEFGTQNRTYCSNLQCGIFLLPTPEAEYEQCPTCQIKTCTTCKSTQHEGECQKDEAREQLEALTKEKGWQKCPNCPRVIELSDGCNHMICQCKMQFCYLCGARWKTCECPHTLRRMVRERASDLRRPEERMGELERPRGSASANSSSAEGRPRRTPLPEAVSRCEWEQSQVNRVPAEVPAVRGLVDFRTFRQFLEDRRTSRRLIDEPAMGIEEAVVEETARQEPGH